MDIDDDLVRLIAELAFVAGDHRLTSQTASLVGALEVLRPGSERPYLIQALALLGQGDAAGAERVLRQQALTTKPDSAMALAYLGLALHQQGRMAERDRTLHMALTSEDKDEDAVRLARSLLEAPAT
jgi:Flp pilus assembly protein TadD